MTIGEVAKKSGLAASAIRFYEQAGVLPAPKRMGGRRLYEAAVLERLAVLERAKACGFSLAEARQLFFGFHEGVPPSERWRALAQRKLAELEELERSIAAMREMLQRPCQCKDLGECGRKMAARQKMSRTLRGLAFFVIAGLAWGQPAPKKTAPPLQSESASTFHSTTAADGEQTIEIRNVSYEVSWANVPGRPPDERLLLRNTVRSKQVLGDIGEEATVTLEAWPLGRDPRQKPLYRVVVEGAEGHSVDGAIFVVARGLNETEWWSVYKLGSGQHLFDTYVPLVRFSIARDTVKTRYVGLDVPEDHTKDARLKQPDVVAVVTYASEDHVIREALLTCDDRERAVLLRWFADGTRTLSLVEDPSQASRTLKLYFSENYPSAANPVEVRIPVRNDDLDVGHAQLPARMHLTAWRR